MWPFVVGERRCASMRARRSFDQHRRSVDRPQGCALCLIGAVRRAYQHAYTTGVGERTSPQRKHRRMVAGMSGTPRRVPATTRTLQSHLGRLMMGDGPLIHRLRANGGCQRSRGQGRMVNGSRMPGRGSLTAVCGLRRLMGRSWWNVRRSA
jgi:hypothetical protein